MNAAGLANLFQQNHIFQQNRPLGQKLTQPTAHDALRRVSEHLTGAQNQGKDLSKRFDTLELSAEAAGREENPAFRDMPEGLLHFYLNQCKVGMHLSQQQENALTEYRDQLSALDQTVQDYQDMVDGKKALPGQMKMEDAVRLLEAVKAAREQFRQKGAEELNRLSDSGITRESFLGKAYRMAAGGNENADSHWQIDPSADDIYSEIDHARSAAHEVTETFRKGASGILAELRRRGCVEPGEEFSPAGPETDSTAGRTSLFQSIYEELWSMFRQRMAEPEDAGNL